MHQLHVPGTIAHAAVEYASNNSVLAQDYLFVEAALGVVQRDLFVGLIARGECPGREDIDAGYLEAVKTGGGT